MPGHGIVYYAQQEEFNNMHYHGYDCDSKHIACIILMSVRSLYRHSIIDPEMASPYKATCFRNQVFKWRYATRSNPRTPTYHDLAGNQLSADIDQKDLTKSLILATSLAHLRARATRGYPMIWCGSKYSQSTPEKSNCDQTHHQKPPR